MTMPENVKLPAMRPLTYSELTVATLPSVSESVTSTSERSERTVRPLARSTRSVRATRPTASSGELPSKSAVSVMPNEALRSDGVSRSVSRSTWSNAARNEQWGTARAASISPSKVSLRLGSSTPSEPLKCRLRKLPSTVMLRQS